MLGVLFEVGELELEGRKEIVLDAGGIVRERIEKMRRTRRNYSKSALKIEKMGLL